jgi:hypothetical protein
MPLEPRDPGRVSQNHPRPGYKVTFCRKNNPQTIENEECNFVTGKNCVRGKAVFRLKFFTLHFSLDRRGEGSRGASVPRGGSTAGT